MNTLTGDDWGVKINHRPQYSYSRGKFIPQGCPEWATPQDIEAWENRGLVAWSNLEKRIVSVKAADALRLLERFARQ